MRSPDPFIHGADPEAHQVDPYDTLCRSYVATSAEVDAVLPVDGALPEALRGVLYRNGPGRLEMGGDRYTHPFDGDGMVCRFELDGATVRYRNRFVRTREYLEEMRAGRMLYRGFGTNLPGGILANIGRARFKNAANTSVLHHAGKLFALWEGGLPHRLDPRTLDTMGRDDLDGALKTEGAMASLMGVEPAFAAHPRVDPGSGELWSFGTRAAPKPQLVLYRFDAELRLLAERVIDLESLPFVHDFVLTERYAVFFLPPMVFDLGRAFAGLATPVSAISARTGQPMTLLVVPRDGGAVQSIRARPGFVFHHVAAWEEADSLVVYSVRMDEYEGGTIDTSSAAALRRTMNFGAAHLTRFDIDLSRDRVQQRRVGVGAAELPTADRALHGRKHRYAWSLYQAPGVEGPLHTSLAKLDLETGEHVTREFGPNVPGEPIFVRRSDAREDDGWLLSLAYVEAEHRSELMVLDAATLETLATAHLPHHVPPGFHGTFVRS